MTTTRYMRDDLPDHWGFVKLQEKILEIVIYIDQLCRDNGIEYFLMGGTALGAKRHGGFIPWDDDLDIFMKPAQYEKFKQIFKENGNKGKFYLQEWGAVDGMAALPKLRLNNTTYIEGDLRGWDMHHGIYVDIFILHNCPDNLILQLWQCFWAKHLVMRGACNRGYSRRKGVIGFVLKCMRLFPKRFLLKFSLRQVYRFRDRETKQYCHFLGKAIFKSGIYKKDWFVGTCDVPFEKVKLSAPANIGNYLTARFGDYMTPPPPDSIKRWQHAEIWDVDKDFREYVSKINTYADERYLIC